MSHECIMCNLTLNSIVEEEEGRLPSAEMDVKEKNIFFEFCDAFMIPLGAVSKMIRRYDSRNKGWFCSPCKTLILEMLHYHSQKDCLEKDILELQQLVCEKIRQLVETVEKIDNFVRDIENVISELLIPASNGHLISRRHDNDTLSIFRTLILTSRLRQTQGKETPLPTFTKSYHRINQYLLTDEIIRTPRSRNQNHFNNFLTPVASTATLGSQDEFENFGTVKQESGNNSIIGTENHLNENPLEYAEPTVEITLLGENISKKRNKSRNVTERVDHKCSECGKSFISKSKLTCHEETHSKSIVKKVSCSFCGKILSEKSIRFHYKLVHGNVNARKYSCTFCEKKFISSTILTNHIRSIHTKERPYCCDTCMKKFVRLSDLKAHTKSVHSDKKPYICPMCPARYPFKFRLKRHVKLYHHKRNLNRDDLQLQQTSRKK